MVRRNRLFALLAVLGVLVAGLLALGGGNDRRDSPPVTTFSQAPSLDRSPAGSHPSRPAQRIALRDADGKALHGCGVRLDHLSELVATVVCHFAPDQHIAVWAQAGKNRFKFLGYGLLAADGDLLTVTPVPSSPATRRLVLSDEILGKRGRRPRRVVGVAAMPRS
jgi:hypothetical protein